jgi:hypothetical protein
MILRFFSGSPRPQRRQETLLGVDADHAHAHVLGEHVHHLIALAQRSRP